MSQYNFQEPQLTVNEEPQLTVNEEPQPPVNKEPQPVVDATAFVQPRQLSHLELVAVFEQVFWAQFNTRLRGEGEEPVYLPAGSERSYHQIVYAHDYAASALHEVAHWCVAGAARRQRVDFGYWYAPDGRTESQQRQFELVEVKPQALEWLFSMAAGCRFRVSADNLAAGLGASDQFKDGIHQQAQHYCRQGVPDRPRHYIQALARCSGFVDPLNAALYQRENL